MSTYRVLEKSFINNGLREEGDIVEYQGRAGSNLELVGGSDPEIGAQNKKWAPKGKRPSSEEVA